MKSTGHMFKCGGLPTSYVLQCNCCKTHAGVQRYKICELARYILTKIARPEIVFKLLGSFASEDLYIFLWCGLNYVKLINLGE